MCGIFSNNNRIYYELPQKIGPEFHKMNLLIADHWNRCFCCIVYSVRFVSFKVSFCLCCHTHVKAKNLLILINSLKCSLVVDLVFVGFFVYQIFSRSYIFRNWYPKLILMPMFIQLFTSVLESLKKKEEKRLVLPLSVSPFWLRTYIPQNISVYCKCRLRQ